MKMLLFNIYKMFYIHFNREWYERYPDKKPGFMLKLAASSGLMLFLFIAGCSIWLVYAIIYNKTGGHSSQYTGRVLAIPAMFLCYLLLFKVLGLPDHNYSAPEYRPHPTTIRRTWIIFIINFVIALILLIVRSVLHKH